MTKKTSKTAPAKGRVTLQTSGTARAAAAASGKPTKSRTKPSKAKSAEGAKSSSASAKRSASKGPAARSASKTGGGAKTTKSTSVPKAKKAAKAAAPAPAETARDKERRALALAGAELAIESALDKKAVGPVLIDVSSQASYTDYIGIVSGRSDRQVEAIADHVSVVMKAKGWTLVGREGASNGRWTLLDFGDLILHIFYHPVRDVYDIEGLWAGAPRVTLKNVPPEALHFQADALYASS